jgi:hypothetical protein
MDVETGEVAEGGNIPNLTDEQVREIARGMIDGTIFTSMQLHDKNLLMNVFMPLIFIDEATRLDITRSGVTEMYAYMKDASGIAINGYPTFGSMGLIRSEDVERITTKYYKMKEALDNA